MPLPARTMAMKPASERGGARKVAAAHVSLPRLDQGPTALLSRCATSAWRIDLDTVPRHYRISWGLDPCGRALSRPSCSCSRCRSSRRRARSRSRRRRRRRRSRSSSPTRRRVSTAVATRPTTAADRRPARGRSPRARTRPRSRNPALDDAQARRIGAQLKAQSTSRRKPYYAGVGEDSIKLVWSLRREQLRRQRGQRAHGGRRRAADDRPLLPRRADDAQAGERRDPRSGGPVVQVLQRQRVGRRGICAADPQS